MLHDGVNTGAFPPKASKGLRLLSAALRTESLGGAPLRITCTYKSCPGRRLFYDIIKMPLTHFRIAGSLGVVAHNAFALKMLKYELPGLHNVAQMPMPYLRTKKGEIERSASLAKTAGGETTAQIVVIGAVSENHGHSIIAKAFKKNSRALRNVRAVFIGGFFGPVTKHAGFSYIGRATDEVKEAYLANSSAAINIRWPNLGDALFIFLHLVFI